MPALITKTARSLSMAIWSLPDSLRTCLHSCAKRLEYCAIEKFCSKRPDTYMQQNSRKTGSVSLRKDDPIQEPPYQPPPRKDPPPNEPPRREPPNPIPPPEVPPEPPP